MEPLLTAAEVSKLLGVSVDTLKDWRYLGTGPAYVRVGKRPMYDRRDLERYTDAQRQEAARGA